MKIYTGIALSLIAALAVSAGFSSPRTSAENAVPAEAVSWPDVLHKTTEIDGLEIFYREAGPEGAPNVLLLHGFPTSSHMYRNLIPALRQGGIYARRIELRVVAAPGPAAERAAALREQLEAGETFALVGAFLPGAEQELVAVVEELETPLIGPFTQHPQLGFPLNPRVFYLLPGLEDLGRALVSFAAAGVDGEPPRSVVLTGSEPRLEGAAQAIAERAGELGWPEPAVVRPEDLDVEALSKSATSRVFLLTAGDEQAAFFRQAAALEFYPRVYLPGSLLRRGIFDAPPGFAERIFLAFPTLPSNQTAASAEEYRDLAARHSLPERHLTAQIATLASAHVLGEALKRAGRELSRGRLIEVLEGFSEFDTGLTPHVTYGPNRRVGVGGAYMLAVDLEGKTLVPASGWIASR